MLIPVNKLVGLNRRFSLPVPARSDFERWLKYKEENFFEPVLVYYGHGLYLTCDCELLFGPGTYYCHNNSQAYLIVKDLEAVKERVLNVVVIDDGRIIHVLRQYRPGIDFFPYYTAFNTSPERVRDKINGDVYVIRSFDELMNVARSKMGGKQRFLIVEEI